MVYAWRAGSGALADRDVVVRTSATFEEAWEGKAVWTDLRSVAAGSGFAAAWRDAGQHGDKVLPFAV